MTLTPPLALLLLLMAPLPCIPWPRLFPVFDDLPLSLAPLFGSVCDALSWNLTPPDPASIRSP